MAYTRHEDSRHSWLQVPLLELVSLGIAHEISSYSYMCGTYAYLEEDVDMQTFRRARDRPIDVATVYKRRGSRPYVGGYVGSTSTRRRRLLRWGCRSVSDRFQIWVRWGRWTKTL